MTLFCGTVLMQTPDRGAASATNPVPKRAPDAVVEEKTNTSQAALYRLNGDLNPLHVRTDVSRVDGPSSRRCRYFLSLQLLVASTSRSCTVRTTSVYSFLVTITGIGLCTMGISGKHILKTFGDYSDIKVRFAGVVYPGETVVTKMWKEGNKVIFGKHITLLVEMILLICVPVTEVKERGTPAIANAAATLTQATKAKL
jgi:acyl dehydratase